MDDIGLEELPHAIKRFASMIIGDQRQWWKANLYENRKLTFYKEIVRKCIYFWTATLFNFL